MKFLIDECLSPELVALARAWGFHESTHVTWLGMRSRKDWAIVGRAIEESHQHVRGRDRDAFSCSVIH